MSRSDDAAFEEFFSTWRRKLVMFGIGQGASWSDAEDAAQAVFMRAFWRWSTVRNQDAYIYRAMKNELAAIAQRQRADLARAEGWASQRVELSAADIYHRGEVEVVRDCLTILPPGQREVVAGLYDGYRPEEIADALGKSHQPFAQIGDMRRKSSNPSLLVTDTSSADGCGRESGCTKRFSAEKRCPLFRVRSSLGRGRWQGSSGWIPRAAHAGVNGIALAAMIGVTVTVSRWEHYVQDQHNLSCVAAPVHNPRDRRVVCILNLTTGTQMTMPHAIKRQLDTIALRLHQQLRSW